MVESGIVGGGYLGVGNFEFSSVDEVSTPDAARRARERVELVDLLSRFAGAAPDLCCDDLNGQCCSGESSSCDCDRPGSFESFGIAPDITPTRRPTAVTCPSGVSAMAFSTAWTTLVRSPSSCTRP